MLEDIFSKLTNINDNIENNNYFFENFPIFLKDLNYILVQLPKDYKQLPIKVQFLRGDEIGNLVTKYYINLVIKYMKSYYNVDIKIKNDNIATMAGGLGSYDIKDDCIYISELFSSFHIDTLQTLFHEVGHKRQKDFQKINNFEELLKYPHYMIILLKEVISVQILEKKDYSFYQNNYSLLYFEQEANVYSHETITSLLDNTYRRYLKFAKKNNIEITNDLLNMLEITKKTIDNGLKKNKNKLITRGQFNIDLINELSSNNAINSKVVFNGSEVDRLILYNKYIKDNPNLHQDYPILQLLFNSDKPKTYQEIIGDFQIYLKQYPEFQDKIKKIYYCIIKSNPILYIYHLIDNNHIEILREFLCIHETLLREYEEEIHEIVSNYDNDLIRSMLQRKIK